MRNAQADAKPLKLRGMVEITDGLALRGFQESPESFLFRGSSTTQQV